SATCWSRCRAEPGSPSRNSRSTREPPDSPRRGPEALIPGGPNGTDGWSRPGPGWRRRRSRVSAPEGRQPPGASDRGADVDAVFAALADPTRRRLLDQLSSDGPLTATELAGSYPVSRQAVVKHLSALAAAGLLDAERHGREVRYGVVPGRLGGASSWL